MSLLSFSGTALPPMLENLEIEFCPILESLPEGMMQNNTCLQGLSICNCEKLEVSLGEDHMRHNHYASSLTRIFIVGSCPSLMSFPLASFTKLEHLCIGSCRNLESLYIPIPEGFHHVDLTTLRSLYIHQCPNLVSFPLGGLPTPNLTSLSINSCNNLKSLPQGMHTLLTSLQQLYIQFCPEIDSFPDGCLPTNTSELCILDSNKLVNRRMEWGLANSSPS